MKKEFTLFTLLVLLFASGNLFSQSCYPDGIMLSYQSEIDQFIIDNPDCTTIEGNVTFFWTRYF